MPTVEVIAKWDKEKNEWRKATLKERGRSFAFTNFTDEKKDNVNYIFFSPGERVEDHSKDYQTMSIKVNNMNSIIKHYEDKNENYDFKMFFMDADAPIKEDAKLFASVVEDLCKDKETNSVTLVGFSKCSVMNMYIPKHFKEQTTFDKTSIINVASPYTGTIMASPKLLREKGIEVLIRKLHNEKASVAIVNKLFKLYRKISSNSHMDYDIALLDGVEDDQLSCYDRTLIENVFCKENIESIKQLKSFRNVVTGIDKKTWKEALRQGNFLGLGLCICNRLFQDNESDGLVKTKSQESITEVLDIKNDYIRSSHHHITSNNRTTKELLSVIDDTIEKGYQKRI